MLEEKIIETFLSWFSHLIKRPKKARVKMEDQMDDDNPFKKGTRTYENIRRSH